MLKKLIIISVLIITVIIIKNLYVSIKNLSNNSRIVDNLQKQLEAQKKENNFLQQKLSYVKSNEFVEKEARDKLGLVKNNEYIVIAPEQDAKKEEVEKTEDPNWKKWLKLFF